MGKFAGHEEKTVVAENGLRYKSKQGGSPFGMTLPMSHSNLVYSCFICGTHRTRANLKPKRVLGRNQYVCSPSCKEMQTHKSLSGKAPPVKQVGKSVAA